MDALTRSLISQAPKLASTAATAMASAAGIRHHHRQVSSSGTGAGPSWPNEAAPTPRVNRRTELDYEELSTLLLREDVSLIDVRHANELHEYGEIPGSVNIPLNDLKSALQLPEEQWIHQFQLNKPEKQDRNLVFYARGPNTSRAAVEIAHRLGFKGSRHYSGGWEDYCQQTGVPLKKTPDMTMNSEFSTNTLTQSMRQKPTTTTTTQSAYYLEPYDFMV